MRRSAFGKLGMVYRLFDRFLPYRCVNMVAFIFLRFPQKSQRLSREKPLPDKFPWRRSYICDLTGPAAQWVGSAKLPTGFDSNGGQTMRLFAHPTRLI